ncbi:MAG: hypothetical protein P8163_03115 [Candidatus Thiodiazotropha sp.]
MLYTSHEPMGIALLGLNEKDQPMMEMFLQRNWSSECIVVPDHQAKLCILDLDGVEGDKLLQRQQSDYSDRPLIVLSVHEKSIEGARVLRKPLRTEQLRKTIDDCRSMILQENIKITKAKAESERIVRIKPSRVSAIRVTPESDQKRYVKPGKNQRRLSVPSAVSQARIIQSSCGNSADGQGNKNGKDDYYNHQQNFQEILKSAIDSCRSQGKPAHLFFQDGKSITILPKSNQCLNAITDSKLKPRCLLKLKSDQVQVLISEYSESQLLIGTDVIPQPLDALLWKVSLWSSRGRLPLGTIKDSAIGIRQWPNMTRLLTIPDFIRIAALWSKKPRTLAETIEILNIEISYVYAFFSACHALGLIQYHSGYRKHGDPVKKATEKSANPGILRRILRRLQAV